MRRYRLDPKHPRHLMPDEARRLSRARIDYSDIPPLEDSILRNPEVVAAIAMRAFARAKREAIETNDRLGIPNYGADERGKIIVRQPGARPTERHRQRPGRGGG